MEIQIIRFFFRVILTVMLVNLCLVHCDREHSETLKSNVDFDKKQFNSYWNQGQAELSRYSLKQARYGEIRTGDAILIFVTEEFLKDKQVKLESNERKNALSILKLNIIKKFPTGIYDYSMMGSIFTPINFNDNPRSLKVTTTSQEWCGHTFTQFNLQGTNYLIRQFSYFEKENDQKFKIPAGFLEDDTWTRLRISPELLPRGQIEIVPGGLYIRLSHIEIKSYEAFAFLENYRGDKFKGADLQVYRIEYPKLERQLSIVFERRFPYKISGWYENYVSGGGDIARRLTTEATMTHRIMTDYWSKNSINDAPLRASLGLK